MDPRGSAAAELSPELEGAARYAGLLLAPAEGFGLRPRSFFALRAKKDLLMSVWAQIWEFLVISSNLSKV